ncbi:hypothetical protein M1D93_03140 [Arthrobacter sp. Z1-9]
MQSGPCPAVGRHANSTPLEADIPSLAGTSSLDGRKLLAMHGIGPKAVRILQSAAVGSGLTYEA